MSRADKERKMTRTSENSLPYISSSEWSKLHAGQKRIPDNLLRVCRWVRRQPLRHSFFCIGEFLYREFFRGLIAIHRTRIGSRSIGSRGERKPEVRLGITLLDTDAFGVYRAEVQLSVEVALFGSLAIPEDRLY